MQPAKPVVLDGESLSLRELHEIGFENRGVVLSEEAWERVRRGRAVIRRLLDAGETVYGINTGFGMFSNVRIEPTQLKKLQVNLIRSHASGTGENIDWRLARMLFALRINVLAKGHSGVREETLRRAVSALNAGCIPAVPEQGTVGASGDLAPLAHLALGLMGEGDMWHPQLERFSSAAQVLQEYSLPPVQLHSKEGLALINGTQFISAIGAEACMRAGRCVKAAILAGALTLEVLKGTRAAFHPRVHAVRPHAGQNLTAALLRAVLHTAQFPSEISQSHRDCSRVQDSYTLRCMPQVHGVAMDTLRFVSDVLSVEMNSATDNPMIFADMDMDEVGMDVCRSCTEIQKMRSPSPTSPSGGLKRVQSQQQMTVDAWLDKLLVDEDDREMVKKVFEEHCIRTWQDVNALSRIDLAEMGLPIGVRNRLLQRMPPPRVESDLEAAHVQEGYFSKRGAIISGGNFHGEYPAKVLDYLAIGIHELAAISERRIERMCNPDLSGLPAFLIESGGLNSGFMIAHCCAASLVSENKVLCHPSSVDSISTSAAKEDHVSMGGMSARKALRVVEHVEKVLAIEILAACQALDLLRPLRTTEPLEAVYNCVREHVQKWDEDRYMKPDIDAVHKLVRDDTLWQTVLPFLRRSEVLDDEARLAFEEL